MLDFTPATSALIKVVEGVRDDQLGSPTPCTDASVGDLIDHARGFCVAFAAAARKLPPMAPTADGSRLGPGWRAQLPHHIEELAAAWRDEAAWSGVTKAGGPDDLPAELAAAIAMDEVIVHSWDIAAATGQSYSCDPALIDLASSFAGQVANSNPEGTPGLFGPAYPVPAGAAPLDRLLGITGRDPAWRPGTED